jgi:hypothetical protein
MSIRSKALALGGTDIRPSWRKNKKLAVLYSGRWVHFGDSRYEDYTTHGDPERRAAYRKRHKTIRLKDGRPAYLVKASPAYWAYQLLW